MVYHVFFPDFLPVNLDPKVYTHCCLRNLVGQQSKIRRSTRSFELWQDAVEFDRYPLCTWITTKLGKVFGARDFSGKQNFKPRTVGDDV